MLIEVQRRKQFTLIFTLILNLIVCLNAFIYHIFMKLKD